MYADPAYIRKHAVKLSLSDKEVELLDALCLHTGQQKAVLVRELLLERARQVLHDDEDALAAVQSQRSKYGLTPR
jgi:predicted DNA-binding protein